MTSPDPAEPADEGPPATAGPAGRRRLTAGPAVTRRRFTVGPVITRPGADPDEGDAP